MTTKKLLVLLGLCCIFQISAHPHMWVDTSLEPRFDANGLSGFAVTWLFDQFFSSDLILDADRNRDGVLSASEIKWLKDNVFDHLEQINYFFQVQKGDQNLTLPTPRDFSAAIVDQRIKYEFFFPLQKSWAEVVGLKLINFDQSYYTFFEIVSTGFSTRVGNRNVRVDIAPEEWETDGWGRVPLTTMLISL